MRERLSEYDKQAVDQYERYVIKLQTEKDKSGSLKNVWATKIPLDNWIAYFEKVAATGFFIDGENITIGNNGISLNYQAYKNLVIRKYPEATFDIQLVRKGDEFSFFKANGTVSYSHVFTNPFSDEDYIGGYCIIKLRTGEFIELLSVKDLEKIRKTAKTDYIWKEWLSEMYLKTILKRACKRHMKDVVEVLDRMDNDNYELPEGDEPDDVMRGLINACKTNEELTALWNKHKSDKRSKEETKAVIDACAARKAEILKVANESVS